MWNRRDAIVLATAAVATFGLTVTLFWPRLANALGDQAVATTELKVPTLDLGAVHVSAALDARQNHTVAFTVRNLTDKPAAATFTAGATVQAPSSPFSRIGPMGREVWKQEYSLDLKPGETQTISVDLPDAAFASAETASPAQAPRPGTVPGRGYLSLRGNNGAQVVGITALTLWTGPASAPLTTTGFEMGPAVKNAPVSPVVASKGTP